MITGSYSYNPSTFANPRPSFRSFCFWPRDYGSYLTGSSRKKGTCPRNLNCLTTCTHYLHTLNWYFNSGSQFNLLLSLVRTVTASHLRTYSVQRSRSSHTISRPSICNRYPLARSWLTLYHAVILAYLAKNRTFSSRLQVGPPHLHSANLWSWVRPETGLNLHFAERWSCIHFVK